MMVRAVIPEQREIELDDLLDVLADPAHRSEPFHPRLIAFCDGLSQALFAHAEAQQFPEIQALAFWLRRASVERLRKGFESLRNPQTVLVPRGFAFHVAPANVDTIFVYSWILSLLCGNSNLLRISQRQSPPTRVLCDVLSQHLSRDEFQAFRGAIGVITYGHEADITAAISARADLRIIWGGDNTVKSIKSIPAMPAVKDLVFCDRYSFSVMHASSFLQCPSDRREALTQAFYNDAYWFSQMGCSSPRTIFWVGEELACREAAEIFGLALNETIRKKKYVNDLGAVLEVMTHAFTVAAHETPVQIHRLSNELTVADRGLTDQGLDREHCGHGFFISHHLNRLDEIIPLISRRDQTMTCFGLEDEEVRGLVQRLQGRGVDRIVPVGSALEFDRYWDGYDLLAEMTRRVFIGYASKPARI